MKKTVALLLVVGLFAGLAAACGGSNIVPEGVTPEVPVLPDAPDNEVEPIVDDGVKDPIEDIEIVLPGEGEDPNIDTSFPYYISVSGIVVSIEEANGLTRVEIEDADGNPAFLVLDEDTVFPFLSDYAVGDNVRGWYLANAPMIMIWPPEYSIKVLATDPGDMNIQVNRFHAWDLSAEQAWISQNEDFVFTTDENTEIILQNGDDFSDGLLEGRRIIVIYGPSTRSIPEMATAIKLIVLYEDIMPLG